MKVVFILDFFCFRGEKPYIRNVFLLAFFNL